MKHKEKDRPTTSGETFPGAPAAVQRTAQQAHHLRFLDEPQDIAESIGWTIPESVGSTIWPMTTSGLLIGRWENAWELLNGLPRTGLFETMVSRYTDPRRHYHTLAHLAECFGAFDKLSHHCDHPMEVEMAIWFHDAIYDPVRLDNELRSSELAFSSLTESGIELLCASRIAKLVIATDHRRPPASVDAGILVDVDLAILGADKERFRQYESQIRWEYGYLSDEAYLRGRMQFVARLLKKFKSGGHIYCTPEFRRDLEPRAVANLQASLKRMRAGLLPARMPMMKSGEK